MIAHRRYTLISVTCLSIMLLFSVQLFSVDNRIRSKTYPHKAKPFNKTNSSQQNRLKNKLRNRIRKPPQRIQVQRVIPNTIVLTSGITGRNIRVYGKHLNLYKSLAVYSNGSRKRHEFAIRIIQARPNQILLNIRLMKPLNTRTQYKLKLYGQNKLIRTPLVIQLRNKPGKKKNKHASQLRLKQRARSTLKSRQARQHARTRQLSRNQTRKPPRNLIRKPTRNRARKLSRKASRKPEHRIRQALPAKKVGSEPKRYSGANSRVKPGNRPGKTHIPPVRTPGLQTAYKPVTLKLSIRSVGFAVDLKPRVVKLSINSTGFDIAHSPRTVKLTIQSKGFHVKLNPRTITLSIRSEGLDSN
ncbi:hypothetical protein MNBD_GAMMA12-3495 [hydrothermal vent metagenome]|uniref:Uncharacterized protein n=1 Tax=hydrothermal vent metagenome TaxID=652676 RepID=A0A3B0YJ42_9ZZZZ